MSYSIAYSLSDSLAMTSRSVRGATRQVDVMVTSVLLPVFLMLLFVYVFGGAMDVGTDYAQFVVPGVIVLCAGFGAASIAVSVASDMEAGVIDRFRSMPIARSSVLVGHVVTSVARNVVSIAIVFGVAWLTGFRSRASLLDWLAVAGILVLFVLAMSWVATAIGLLVRNAEAANGATFVMLFLPYVSSAFVPTETMPAPLGAVARHQPITPLIDSVRALLTDLPVGNDAWSAIAWFSGILVVAWLVSARLFARGSR